MATVLVVDDEPDMRWLLSAVLEAEKLKVLTAGDGYEAVASTSKHRPDVVLLDLKMPKMDGMAALEKLVKVDANLPVIIVTSYGNIPSAVQAMKAGAYDFLTKPFTNQELIFAVKRALEKRGLLIEVAALKDKAGSEALDQTMGRSRQIGELFLQIQQVAATNYTVILQGETGTGKEIVARVLHQQSQRRDKPFVALDCGAIPESLIESELFGHKKGAFTGADRQKAGYFELAQGGTLFLDEIANLPLALQGKLLRALQERQIRHLGGAMTIDVDVRIVAASNLILGEEVEAGRFRRDLYHRLSEFTISIPPLRKRKEDIAHLANRFLEEARMELKTNVRTLSEEAIEVLLNHPWPGNVRELKNVMRRAVLVSPGVIRPEHLSIGGPMAQATFPPAAFEEFSMSATSFKEICKRTKADVERRMILQALKESKGNQSQAARNLNLDYKTFRTKVKRYGVRPRELAP